MPRQNVTKERRCYTCKKWFPLTGAHFCNSKKKFAGGFTYQCKSCQRKQQSKNVYLSCPVCEQEYKKINSSEACEHCLPYYKIARQKIQSTYGVRKLYTPKWSNSKTRKVIIATLAYKLKEGTELEIDHIVPITHPLVCGLNCEDNLRLIPKKLNRLKSNLYWPGMWDEMMVKGVLYRE